MVGGIDQGRACGEGYGVGCGRWVVGWVGCTGSGRVRALVVACWVVMDLMAGGGARAQSFTSTLVGVLTTRLGDACLWGVWCRGWWRSCGGGWVKCGDGGGGVGRRNRFQVIA